LQGLQGRQGFLNLYNQSTPPVSPVIGDYWIDSDTGNTYIYYNDGDSSQWIEFGPDPTGPEGAQGVQGLQGGGGQGTQGLQGRQGTQGLQGTFPTINRTVGVSIDGGGTVITTGTKGYVEVPYAGTINEWKIIADVSGSAVFDVWKSNAAIPTNANTITASAKPTLTAAQRATGTTLTGWTTGVSVNDVFGFEVESASTITKVVLILVIQQT
jgi:hypothetical protein